MAFSLSSTFEELPLTASHSKDPWVDLRLYGRRLLKPASLDVEYVLWQMLQLCVEPKRVYRTTTFHSRVKHQWARDDPAFVVVLAYMLAVAGVAWCLAFGQGAEREALARAADRLGGGGGGRVADGGAAAEEERMQRGRLAVD